MAIPNSPNWSNLNNIRPYPSTDFPKPEPLEQLSVFNIALGPIALNDSQGKINSRYWLCAQESGFITIRGASGDAWGEPVQLIAEPLQIMEMGLSFDQLGRPMVFYRVNQDTLKLYWYSPVDEVNEIKDLATGIDPNIGMDAPQETSASYSDNMLFYVRDGAIFMRIQRDRFETEYTTPATNLQDLDILNNGLRVDNRYQVVYAYHDTGYVPEPIEPPTPPVISGDYHYRVGLKSGAASRYHTQQQVTQNVAADDLAFGFACKGVNDRYALVQKGQLFEPANPHPSWPVVSETDLIGPQNSRSNSQIMRHPLLPWLSPSQQAASGKYSHNESISNRLHLEFFEYAKNKWKFILVINGAVNILECGFAFQDGEWLIQIQGNGIAFWFNGELQGSSAISKGASTPGGTHSNPIMAFGAGLAQTGFATNKKLMECYLSNLSVSVNGNVTMWPVATKNEPVQPSSPPGNDIHIELHRNANWAFINS